MYVGRIVAVGRTRAGANAALYRVSSRSFPNRRIVEAGGHLAVVEPYPRDEARRRQLMEMAVANHPHYYLREEEILDIISARSRGLEEPEEQEPVSFRVPKNKSTVNQP